MANGVGTIADFSTLDIATARTVNLAGNYTVGTLIFEDDTNASHNWALANGSGGPWALTLAAVVGNTPNIQVLNQVATISAVLAGTQGVKKTGAGTLTLTGANTLSGGINLAEGVLNFANGSLASNVVTFTADATLGWQGGHTQDVSALIKIEDGVTATLNTGASDVTFATALQTGLTGTGSILKNGAGALIITAANSYSGLTRVRQGRMILTGGDNRLSSAGSIALGQNAQVGILQLGSVAGASHQTTTALSGTAGSSVVGGHQTVSILTINNSTSVSFAGMIGGAGANENNIGLVKTGAGDFTVSNTGNCFTGGTTLQQGTLTFSVGALSNTGQIGFAGNATLEWGSGNTQDISARLLIQDGVIATLATNANTVTLATALQTGAVGNGALTKGGAGTLIITAANTYSGNTRINNGRVILSGGDNRLSVETALQFGSNANSGVIQLGDSNGASNQTVTGLSITGNVNSSTSNAIVGGNAAISTLTVNNSANVTWNQFLGGSGANENNLALVKTGTAVLTLGGNNTFVGNVDIAAGSLAITRAEALGSGVKTVTVRGTASAATFRLTGGVDGIALADNVSFVLSNDVGSASGILSTAGNNTIAGSIALTTSSSGTRTSRIRVNADSLAITGSIAPSSTATTPVTVIFDAQSGATVSVSGTVSDTGATVMAVRKDSAGSLILTGNNTYTGVTNITGGVVQVGVGGDGSSVANATSSGTTGTGLTTVSATATLSGSGLVKGRLAIDGGTLSPGDTIAAAGDKIGTLWVGGNTTYTAGTLLLQIKSSSLNVAGLADSLVSGYDAARLSLTTSYATQLAAAVGIDEYDHIDINGSFDWAATGSRSVSISLEAGYSISAGDVFNLLDWTSVKNPLGLNVGDVFRAGGELGTELVLPSLGGGLGWDTTYFAQHGILIVTQISNIPEPGRAVLVLGGLITVLLRRRRPFSSQSRTLWSSASTINLPRHPGQTE